MVELLVVIGIIGLLVSILLPALGKARKSAQAAACLANLKQLTNAAFMWTNDNGGWMIGRAASGGAFLGINSSGQPILATNQGNLPSWGKFNQTTNWIAWDRYVDPITGQMNAKMTDQNITYSALAKYLGGHYTVTGAYGFGPPAATGMPPPTSGTPLPVSNNVNVQLDNIFICPADNRGWRPSANGSITGSPFQGLNSLSPYRYSYSLNDLVANPVKNQPVDAAIFTTPGFAFANGQRSDFTFNGKASSIKHTSQIIMFVCEDEQSLDDPVYVTTPEAWNPSSGGPLRVNAVASRHQNFEPLVTVANQGKGGVNVDAIGICSFCDGHAENVSRKDALRQAFTGNPNPDPVGF